MIFRTKDDLDLKRIAESGQAFRWEERGGDTWRVIRGSDCVYMRDPGNGTIVLDCSEEEFRSVWYGYLDLDCDYAAVRGRIRRDRDPFLYEAARAGRGIRILRQDPWETLVSFLISQNKNIPAIRRSIRLLAEACGERKTDSRGESYCAFPSPGSLADLSDAGLRACGVGYRAPYIHAAAEAVCSGRLDPDALKTADEETAFRVLTGLAGVGPKVAACVMLFGLHMTDAFPRDVWILRVLQEHYPGGYPFSDYAPYNGIYQQYLFAYARGQGAE